MTEYQFFNSLFLDALQTCFFRFALEAYYFKLSHDLRSKKLSMGNFSSAKILNVILTTVYSHCFSVFFALSAVMAL